MTVAKYTAPNYTDADQTAAIYKGYIDGGMSVLHAVAGDFAPHAQDTPAMTIQIDAGKIIKGDGTLTEQAAQNTGTITAPVTNPRIDRVVIDASTGAVSVITGAEAASPSAPSITAGKLPVAQIALTTSTTAITNSVITDERTAYRDESTMASLTVTGASALGSAAISAAGVMTAGTVPLDRMKRTEATGSGAADCGTVVAGDRIVFTLYSEVVLASGSCISFATIQKTAGTATIQFLGGLSSVKVSTYAEFAIQGANPSTLCATVVAEVTVGGTLTMGVSSVTSTGTSPTVSNTKAYALVLNNG